MESVTLEKKLWAGEKKKTTMDSKNKLTLSYRALTVIRVKESIKMPARRLVKYLP